MIHRLRLRNWRSYEDLNLQLEPGTTFIVAPNGVGKTSLVYSLAWGVFGQYSSVDPKACIRAGAASTEVHVEVDLADGRRLSISRTAKRRGAPTTVYRMYGARLTESSALAEMEQAWGIELPVASRLSMMLGGGHIATIDTLDLESHLHHAFGVGHILSAAKTAKSVAKEAVKARVALRSATRKRIEDRAAMESEITELEEEVIHLRKLGTELENVREAAAAHRSLVERHLALVGQLERYEQQRSHLISKIEDLLGRPVSTNSNESIGFELRAELETSERAIADFTENAILARSVIMASQQAVRLLGKDHVICPTCMRPLPHRERTSAITTHRKQQEDAEAEVKRVEKTLRATQRHSQVVSRLLSQLEALQSRRIHTKGTKFFTRAEADVSYQQASADLDEHNQRLGRAQSRLEWLKAQLASNDQIQKEKRDLRLAFRREAAALAGAEVLREAADHVIETRIGPMANDVRKHWKHLFTNNGLIFRPDGSITRSRDGEELGWDTLSGGERTWARIVTHLIVMATTTSLPFAWFDEPLEHLDPQLRHAVAATLATATRGGSPRQLLVTTYEHGIAQQLADDTNGAEIISIREARSSFGATDRQC